MDLEFFVRPFFTFEKELVFEKELFFIILIEISVGSEKNIFFYYPRTRREIKEISSSN